MSYDVHMPRLPSLPDSPTLDHVFRRFPHGVHPLMAWHDAVLRGPSPLTVGERELIAAYVSGLNACGYCQGAHRSLAETWGIEPAVFERLVADPEAAMGPAWAALLAYLRKLTFSPAQLTDDDARKTLEAGWDERALYDAIMVCSLVNCTNRIVDGLGIPPDPSTPSGERRNYTDYARDLGLVME